MSESYNADTLMTRQRKYGQLVTVMHFGPNNPALQEREYKTKKSYRKHPYLLNYVKLKSIIIYSFDKYENIIDFT